MKLDAQRVLDIFQAIETELLALRPIFNDLAKSKIDMQIYMLHRLRDQIFTPEELERWEHETSGYDDDYDNVDDLDFL